MAVMKQCTYSSPAALDILVRFSPPCCFIEAIRSQWLTTCFLGGEALVPYFGHHGFHFFKGDVCEKGVVRQALIADGRPPLAVVHLAAIVGFLACQQVGAKVAWHYNVRMRLLRSYNRNFQGPQLNKKI
jgi:hypothetical protein